MQLYVRGGPDGRHAGEPQGRSVMAGVRYMGLPGWFWDIPDGGVSRGKSEVQKKRYAIREKEICVPQKFDVILQCKNNDTPGGT